MTYDQYTPSITTQTGFTSLALNTTGPMAAGTGATQLSAAATISDKTQNSVIGLTNTLAEVSPTGYVSRFAPYALILVAGIVLLIVAKKTMRLVGARFVMNARKAIREGLYHRADDGKMFEVHSCAGKEPAQNKLSTLLM